jgi:dienelactone hydrolase
LDGKSFDSIEEGVGYASSIGFGEVANRAAAAAAELPNELVYIGFSLGVVPAQMLAQTRPGAQAAVFGYSCLPTSEFGSWPAGVPVQIHGAENDPIFMDEGDVDAARELVAEAPEDAELFLYPADQHYFADPSLPSYDAASGQLFEDRVRAFLKDR